MITLKLTSIGNSTGVILPRLILDRLGVSKGDKLRVVELPDGIQLTLCNQEVPDGMDSAKHVAREERDSVPKIDE